MCVCVCVCVCMCARAFVRELPAFSHMTIIAHADYDMVIPGTDLQDSPTVWVTELDVQFSVNNEDTHQYENSASLQNAVPEPESPVYNNECLQLQEDNGPSLNQQTTERDDIPGLTIESECVMTAEDSEGGQPADQEKEELDALSHSSQQQDVQLHGTCSSQSAPQLENQQSVALLDDQDYQQLSPATELELKDSQQSEQLEGDLLEHDQAAEASDEVTQEAAWPKKGEEFQENQIDQEMKEISYQEMDPEEDSNNSPLAMTAENHTAHPEGYQQEPQSAELLEVRVESIEETETKEGMSLYRILDWDGSYIACMGILGGMLLQGMGYSSYSN